MKLPGKRIWRMIAGVAAMMLTVFGVGGCRMIPDAEKHAEPSIYPENEVLSAAAAMKFNEPGMIVVKTFGVSMLPEYREGTIFLFAPATWADLQTGDVIAYRNSAGRLIVHRLIHAYGDHWLVKGDNNTNPDHDFVTPQNLVGKMAYYLLPGTEVENKQ